MTDSKSKYFLAGIIPYVIWGTMSIPLRDIKEYPPNEILYYRVFISIMMIWTIILLFRRKALKHDLSVFTTLDKRKRAKFLLLAIISAILITGNWFTYIYAVNSVSLKSAAFAYLVCPLLTAFCGFIFLKEKLTKIKILAIFLALISIILLASGSLHDVVWSITIASFYALYIVIMKLIKNVDKFNLLGLHLIISGLIMLPYYFSHSNSFPINGIFWSHIFLIAIVFTIIPLFLNSYALLGMPSSTLGILIYVNPIVAFSVAFLYFKDKIDAHQIFAYLMLLFSILIFNTSFLKPLFIKKNK